MGNLSCNNGADADAPKPVAARNTEEKVASSNTTNTTSAEPQVNEEIPSVYVICGPSGVGKGTLLKELYKKLPNILATAVSTTTRAPRQGEIDGTHYHFTDVKTFETMIENNEFLEYAKVHNNYYGTSKAAIKDISNSNQLCILEIDRNGAINVSKDELYGKCAKFIFVTTHETDDINEVIKILRDRLRGRNSETEEQINTRMKTAEAELEFMQEWKKQGKWNFMCVNDELDAASDRLKNKFIEWNPWIKDKLNQ